MTLPPVPKEIWLHGIARQFNAEEFRVRRGGDWCPHMVSVVLQREGKYVGRKNKSSGPRPPRRHDKPVAAALAHELRAEGLSLRLIGVRLRKEGLVPLRGGKWHPASVGSCYATALPATGLERPSELRAQGMSLREVGVRLAMEGYEPESGGVWYPARVFALLTTAESSSRSG